MIVDCYFHTLCHYSIAVWLLVLLAFFADLVLVGCPHSAPKLLIHAQNPVFLTWYCLA